MEERPAQEGCPGRDVLCLAPGGSGVSLEWGAGAVMRVKEQPGGFCWRLAEKKAMERLERLLSPPKTQTLGLCSLCCG